VLQNPQAIILFIVLKTKFLVIGDIEGISENINVSTTFNQSLHQLVYKNNQYLSI